MIQWDRAWVKTNHSNGFSGTTSSVSCVCQQQCYKVQWTWLLLYNSYISVWASEPWGQKNCSQLLGECPVTSCVSSQMFAAVHFNNVRGELSITVSDTVTKYLVLIFWHPSRHCDRGCFRFWSFDDYPAIVPLCWKAINLTSAQKISGANCDSILQPCKIKSRE